MESGRIARFALGQLVHHREKGYRGAIIDVDPVFLGDGDVAAEAIGHDEPLDEPWYHILVNGRDYVSYVSESSLGPDGTGEPVDHPSVVTFFKAFDGDQYTPRRPAN